MKSLQSGKLGTALSLGCAVHCLSFPIIIPFMPALGKELLFSHTTESIIIILAIIFGIYSLYHGYKKHHHNFRAFPVFFAGVFMTIAGQILHPTHDAIHLAWSFTTFLLVAGGVLMGFAQIMNFSLLQKVRTIAGN